jgi:tetratricopeptide (TPR) repeat protein
MRVAGVVLVIWMGYSDLPSGLEAQQQAASKLPTEVLHAMIQEMLTHPDRPQGENTLKFIRLARTQGLDRSERFALAEAYFLAFMPDEAKAIYRDYLEGTDELARVAWQRTMRITFAAEDRPAEAERMLEEFYKKFKPTADDQGYGSQQAADLAGYWRDQGDVQRAVGYIVREFKAVPADGPYVGLTLPGRMSDLFARAGRLEEAKRLTQQALEGLKQVAEREHITSNPYAAANRGSNQPHRAGMLHNAASGLMGDLPDFDRDVYRKGRIYSTIQQLEGMLQRLERSGPGEARSIRAQ